MNKLNKELLDRALVEGVDESFDGEFLSLAGVNMINTGFHITGIYPLYFGWKYVCTKEEYLAAKAEKESRKTVMDAVNEFNVDIHTDIKSFVCNQKAGSIHVWHDDDFTDLNTPTWAPLCSLAEYKEAMADCETNFGTSQSYEEYKKGYKAMGDTKSEYDIGCYYEFSDYKDFSQSKVLQLSQIPDKDIFPYQAYLNGTLEVFKYIRPLTAKAGEIRKHKPLRGFVNVYNDRCHPSPIHDTKGIADEYCNPETRLACIDLSQFNEGEGL